MNSVRVRACVRVCMSSCMPKETDSFTSTGSSPKPAHDRTETPLLVCWFKHYFISVCSFDVSDFLNVQIKDKRVSLNHLNNDRALTSAAMRQRGAVFGLMKGRAPKLNSNSFLKCQQDVTWSFCSLHAVSLMPVWCKRWQKRRFEAAGLALVQDSGYQSFSPGHFYVVFEFLHLPKFGLGLQVVGD